MAASIAATRRLLWRSLGQWRLASTYKPAVSRNSVRPWQTHEESSEGNAG